MGEFQRWEVVAPATRVRYWLSQQGLHAVRLTPLSGLTNHVFLVETLNGQAPRRSVVRLANTGLAAGLCPLAHQTEQVIAHHQAATELGLSPALLAADVEAKLMWLAFAGSPRRLDAAGMVEMRGLLARLHGSGLHWATPGKPDPAGLAELTRLAEQGSGVLQVRAQQLQALARPEYLHYSPVPVHSDLNPGNCLHDGERWWLIDWDYATEKVALWDYASLCVEHDLSVVDSQLFVPLALQVDLAWFCCNFALLSWNWHVERGSAESLIAAKVRVYERWWRYS